MMSLTQFQERNPVTIFTDARSLPAFFETNLVDPARVVKVFENDPQANVRVFYYQYLKLCFEVQTVDYQLYIKKIEELINNETFKFIFFEDDDPSVYNDLQFKRLIMEFFGVLSQATLSIEDALSLYPIIDTVFVYFFRTLLILTGRTDAIDSFIDRDELFEFLATYFTVEVSVHNKCWKFGETDIFVYEEDQREVFMAYMDYDQQFPIAPQYRQDSVNTSQQQHVSQSIAKLPAEIASQPQVSSLLPAREVSLINQSYIASQFMDYTDTRNAPDKQLSSLMKNDLKSSNTMNQQKRGFQNFNQIMNSQPSAVQKKSEDNLSKIIEKQTVANNRVTTPINRIEEDFKSAPKVDPHHSSFDYQNNPKNLSQYDDLSKGPTKKDWQPTKDPGFENSYTNGIIGPLNNGSKYLNSNVQAANLQQPSPVSYSFEVPKYAADSYQQQSFESSYQKSLTSNYQSQFTQSYSKSINSYNKPTDPYQKSKVDNYSLIPSYTDSKDYKKPSYDPLPSYLKPASYDSQNYTGSSSKRNPFGLNVSQQFTNSLTLKSVSQPYRSSIVSIRSKARAFRNSLNSYLK